MPMDSLSERKSMSELEGSFIVRESVPLLVLGLVDEAEAERGSRFLDAALRFLISLRSLRFPMIGSIVDGENESNTAKKKTKRAVVNVNSEVSMANNNKKCQL
jgi:hypothetical protein